VAPRQGRAALLVVVSILAASCGAEPPSPEAGTDLYAVAPDVVVEVLYSSPETKLFAYRWTPAEPFRVTLAVSGRAPEYCEGGEPFTRWLRAVTSIPIRSELEKPLEPGGPQWADLRLKDTSALEPNEVTLRIPDSDTEPVVARVGERQFAVAVEARALRAVRWICTGSDAGAPVPPPQVR
jgi:hypothetical protein